MLYHPSNWPRCAANWTSNWRRHPRLSAKQAAPAEETAFDRMKRAGLIGCLKGTPGTPTDLSTNPKHMEGFGHA